MVVKGLEKITSRDNQRLVNARKVRDGKVRDQIFIEGRRLAGEALRSNLVIDECFVSEDFIDDGILEEITDRGLCITKITQRLFVSIADTKQPQGIILIAKRPTNLLTNIESNLKKSSLPLVIFLKEINNPANLGAIVRTSEAAGVAGLIISNNSADVFSPKSLRAAMGSLFRLPILENSNFDDILQWAKSTSLVSVATTASSVNSYVEIDWKKPRLLIFGSEAHGISDRDLKMIDKSIGIRMEENVESLNLAVAAGVILFEAKRQNG